MRGSAERGQVRRGPSPGVALSIAFRRREVVDLILVMRLDV
jgi:hypothetical protein